MYISEKETYKLKIIFSTEYKYLIDVVVFDSNNRIMEKQSLFNNEITYSLTLGLYTLRIVMNGEVKDDVFFLDQNINYEVANEEYITNTNSKIITPPKQFSSALLGEGYSSSPEYYLSSAIDWSKKDTFINPEIKNINSSVFIFLRFPSAKKYKSLNFPANRIFKDFQLVNEKGEVLVEFNNNYRIETNENDGWVAFNTILPNGIYYLIYWGEEKRQIPIYIFKNWHTQFFLTLGNEPLYGTIRIFFSKNREFNPHNEANKLIDILLDKLQNKDYRLEKDLIDNALNKKYESPMLALVYSYIYLLDSKNKDETIFKKISENIQNAILKEKQDSPDLQALYILASNHFDEYKDYNIHLEGTPMLRIGFEVILKASLQNKNLILENSLNDFISENLYFDSPFNTFKPIPFEKVLEKLDSDIFSNNELSELSILKDNQNSPLSAFSDPILDYDSAISNILSQSSLDHIKSDKNFDKTFNRDSWIKNYINDLNESKLASTSIEDISIQLGVSSNTIKRIINEFNDDVKKLFK